MCDALNELFAEELKEADLRGRTEGLRLGRSEGLQLGKSEGLHQAAVETYQEMGLNYRTVGTGICTGLFPFGGRTV